MADILGVSQTAARPSSAIAGNPTKYDESAILETCVFTTTNAWQFLFRLCFVSTNYFVVQSLQVSHDISTKYCLKKYVILVVLAIVQLLFLAGNQL